MFIHIYECWRSFCGSCGEALPSLRCKRCDCAAVCAEEHVHLRVRLLWQHRHLLVHPHHPALQSHHHQEGHPRPQQVSESEALGRWMARSEIKRCVLLRYWEAVLEMLWPRFELILEMNIHSIRNTDPQKLGVLDTRPHYVGFPCTFYGREECVYIRVCWFQITRRYAEFSSAIVSINQTFPNERTNLLLGQLQVHQRSHPLVAHDRIHQRWHQEPPHTHPHRYYLKTRGLLQLYICWVTVSRWRWKILCWRWQPSFPPGEISSSSSSITMTWCSASSWWAHWLFHLWCSLFGRGFISGWWLFMQERAADDSKEVEGFQQLLLARTQVRNLLRPVLSFTSQPPYSIKLRITSIRLSFSPPSFCPGVHRRDSVSSFWRDDCICEGGRGFDGERPLGPPEERGRWEESGSHIDALPQPFLWCGQWCHQKNIEVKLLVTFFLHCSSYHSAGSRLFGYVETVSGGDESGCHEVLHKLQKWNQHHPGERVVSSVPAVSVSGGLFLCFFKIS